MPCSRFGNSIVACNAGSIDRVGRTCVRKPAGERHPPHHDLPNRFHGLDFPAAIGLLLALNSDRHRAPLVIPAKAGIHGRTRLEPMASLGRRRSPSRPHGSGIPIWIPAFAEPAPGSTGGMTNCWRIRLEPAASLGPPSRPLVIPAKAGIHGCIRLEPTAFLGRHRGLLAPTEAEAGDEYGFPLSRE